MRRRQVRHQAVEPHDVVAAGVGADVDDEIPDVFALHAHERDLGEGDEICQVGAIERVDGQDRRTAGHGVEPVQACDVDLVLQHARLVRAAGDRKFGALAIAFDHEPVLLRRAERFPLIQPLFRHLAGAFDVRPGGR
ncbi:MAG: hypothetical protein RR983_06590 [Massilia sp.]|uniref:hypothetical protein n=1 Tax=Massilia sp. TaxID=1882437 RepID=UPI002FC71DF1